MAQGTVIIQGESFNCASGNININNGEIFIDGKKVRSVGSSNTDITIIGNIKTITTTNGDVKVTGNVDSIQTVNGDVKADLITGSIKTTNGNITNNNKPIVQPQPEKPKEQILSLKD